MILVDSSVLFDVITRDPVWYGWSREALRQAMIAGVGINQIIMAEVSAHFPSAEAAMNAIPSNVALIDLPWEAAHLAGAAFLRYRRSHQGQKTSPMPDFYIYAHCAVAGMPLLTRDRGKASYFPEVELITPDG